MSNYEKTPIQNHNPRVGGSSPSSATNHNLGFVKRVDLNADTSVFVRLS